MSTYIELIKNFERTRAYMREFYVYGFKSRDGYDKKSARSYDDERRRMESWLADHMRFVRTPDGKNVNKEMIEKAHANGIKVNVFYADTVEFARELLDMGADTILTNDYLMMSEALGIK